jgi:hypothetical protein
VTDEVYSSDFAYLVLHKCSDHAPSKSLWCTLVVSWARPEHVGGENEQEVSETHGRESG